MNIAISAESTADLSKELIAHFKINIIPFQVLLGEKEAADGVITPEEIFEYVDQTGVLPKTSAINEFQYNEYFKGLLKEYDAVIHISLSDGISSSFQHAEMAASKLKNVYVINSKSLSTGIALLAIYTRQLIDEGLEVTEIVKKVKDRVPHLQVSFVLNTVEYLYKGGRCSAMAMFGANLLKIKPQILVGQDGKMTSGSKYRGKNRQVVEEYCLDTLNKFNTPDKRMVFVTHSMASPDMVEAAKDILNRKGFHTIFETLAGATISSHCGPKCLGILYFNDGE